MKLKYEWFLGGRIMFWVSIILMILLLIGFIVTYVFDPIEHTYMVREQLDPSSIQKISETYCEKLGIEVDRDIRYSFVTYKDRTKTGDYVLLGTFHEWNDVYYIDISKNLYSMKDLERVVIHETRHMIVEYLRDENIIDLVKYTEEIAGENDGYFEDLFNSGLYLLKLEEIRALKTK